MNALVLVALTALAPAQLDAPAYPDAALAELRGGELSAGYAFALGDAETTPWRLLATARYELSARVIQPRVGAEVQPWRWLALRLDAGPMIGVAPLDAGLSARGLVTLAWRPDPVILYIGPSVDVGGHFTGDRGLRTRALVTTGIGLNFGPLTILGVADLGYAFAALDTGALHAAAGFALQWHIEGPAPG